ncbi:hypothetical protein [Clostridium botulinum]|uniref:hypothetical protein n=1 Tax=Clostridium botulinum TaxID=1491 RepID=UPI000773FA02|nr:hypothetical protein [Clostridium botulinum]
MEFKNWLDVFLNEKNINIKDEFYKVEKNNVVHFIEGEVLLQLIKNTDEIEKQEIKHKLIKIDFYNGNVNDYFTFLAECYVKNNY